MLNLMTIPPFSKVKLNVNNPSITPKSGVEVSLSLLTAQVHGGVHGRALIKLAMRALFLQHHALLSVELMLGLMLCNSKK